MRYFHKNEGIKNKRKRISLDITSGLGGRPETVRNGVISMDNLTTRYLPELRRRNYFGVKSNAEDLSCGVGSIDGVMYYSNGTHFVYDGEPRFEVSEGKKKFENFNGRVLIFPDRIYFDPKTGGHGMLDSSTGKITYKILKRNVGGESWGLSAIQCGDHRIGDLFSEGDGVFIGDNKELGLYGFHTVTYSSPNILLFDKFEFGVGEPMTITGELSRGGPKGCDAACVSGGRVWVASDNRIYASTPNDERNWAVGGDDENTSYMCDMENSDKITYCCELEGSPVFFTANGIYKMYGDRALNFNMRCTVGHGGIEERFKDTAACVGGKVYYLTPSGVCRFDGGTVELMHSSPVGAGVTSAVGGGDADTYYLCVVQNGVRSFFAYDTVSERWQRFGYYFFDNFFVTSEGTCATTGKSVYLIAPANGLPEEYVSERIVTYDLRLGEIDMSDGMMPYCVTLNGDFPDGSYYLQTEYDGQSVQVGVSVRKKYKKIEFLILPRRCERFSLRLWGNMDISLAGVHVDVICT